MGGERGVQLPAVPEGTEHRRSRVIPTAIRAKLSRNCLKTDGCVGLQGTLLIWMGKNRRCL